MVGLRQLLIAILGLSLTGCIVSRVIPTWPGGLGGHITLRSADGFLIPATVNGLPVKLRVETGYAGIILNAAVARRAAVEPSIFQKDISVGPVKVNGNTGVGSFAIGSAAATRRFTWFENDVAAEADGIINVANLPYESVTFELRPPQAGDRLVHLKTNPNGFWHLTYSQPVADRDIIVRFLLDADESLATAAAGSHLAAHWGGAWVGSAMSGQIGLGVERPVREMAFARPGIMAGFAVGELFVRLSDFRGDLVLPTDREGPDQVVVTRKRKASRADFAVILGMDVLSSCSRIIYKAADRSLALWCSGPTSGSS